MNERDVQAERIAKLIAPLRVPSGAKLRLAGQYDPGYTGGLRRHGGGTEALLQRGVALLADYQARLAAQATHGVIVVLQALDAAGKDGTIRHVMSGVNPQGVHVHSFKVPSPEELGHDFLWRYAQRLPSRGEIGIFNRSHYEEVLVVRVHPEHLDRQRLPAEARRGDLWRRRFRAINAWERHLTGNGFRIVKLFLNVSKEEQRKRLLQRIDRPDKNWKFSAADVAERQHWDAYQDAYADMLAHTSTRWAPWYIIPADHKWFARIAAAAVIADTLIGIDPRYPAVGRDAREELQRFKTALAAEPSPGRHPGRHPGRRGDPDG
ncbi:polyphosphate kinase 2 family protein [Dactylosporangium sp. NPDC050688]|uniref:polyphosphate kinase 2 family protein n=1 Tax=Dactylosporangium sp. NPDC050688 TaxID=3157217 RepID=UPI0033DF7C2A